MLKERAKNNRTLTIDPAEEEELFSNITLAEHVGQLSSFEDVIIQGDLLEVLQDIPDGIADLIIIDPPYNLSKDFHGTTFKACSDEEYLHYLRTWFAAVCQKLKPTGSLYMCGDWRSSNALMSVMSDELCVMNRITWQREKGRGAKANWKNTMEDIWFGVKNAQEYYFDIESVKQKRRVLAPYRSAGEPKDWEETEMGNYRLTFPSNLWDDISIPFWSMPENTEHPTQKPEKLYAKLILASSPVGGVIFDPFLGSGTSAAVARKLGRKFIGVEINPLYCLWAAKRVKLANTDKQIQGYSDGVFWERNTLAAQKKQKKPTLEVSQNHECGLFEIPLLSGKE